MTERVQMEWEPVAEGIVLQIGAHTTEMPMTSVIELRDDMEEANMLSRGYSKIDEWAEDVLQYDKMVVCSMILTVSSVLEGRDGTVIQFSECPGELTLPPDQQIVVWRAIE
jgi:hypothetical protein